MLKCGLLGKKLSHSRSPEIHRQLGDYEYLLFEKQEDELEAFLKAGDWTGMNVTIPYKKTVLPYVAELSPIAERIGSVNTLIRRPDGTLFGDNTDVAGFTAMVRFSGLCLRGTKVLVLGSGGASVSVCEGLLELDAFPVVISRRGENRYDNLDKHADASFLVNATPVGMYPDTEESPLDLNRLPACRGVFDLIYNPRETRLMAQAREMGIPAVNGLYMLVAQARKSAELFTGKPIPEEKVEEIYRTM